MTASPITTVLFDADGVLQFAHHDWTTALDGVGGAGFAETVFRHEEPAMRGETTMRACLESACLEREEEHHVGASPALDIDALLALWDRYDIDAAAVGVVQDVRAAGLSACLATSQQDVRRDSMRTRYADVFDEEFYSCELGVTKASPRYFQRLLDARGLAPEQALFVDDSPGNVAVARRLGLATVLHEPASGAHALRREVWSALSQVA